MRVYNNYVSIIIAIVFIDLGQNHGLPFLLKFSNQEAVLNNKNQFWFLISIIIICMIKNYSPTIFI